MHERWLVLALVVFGMVGVATAQENGEQAPVGPSYRATCADGTQVVGFEIALRELGQDSSVRVSMLGVDNFDPIIAVRNADGSHTCANNSSLVVGSAVAVPGVGRVDATPFAAQETVLVGADDAVDLVVGGVAGETGRFAFVVENLTIAPDDETDQMLVRVPPATADEFLGVYMIGEGDLIDPFLSVLRVGMEETPSTFCDNVGVSTCEQTPTFIDGGVLMSDGTQYVGDAFDAGLLGTFIESELQFNFSSSGGVTTGDYAIVMVGTAPGDPVDNRLICNNVATSIVGASPAYNDLYAPLNLLDGNPATVYATNAVELDPETNEPLENVFIVISLVDQQAVSRVRVNTFASRPELRANSTRRFAVLVTNVDGTVITALEAEARLQPGYQTFSFLPANVNEIAILLQENYGGSLFEFADIQVCAE